MAAIGQVAITVMARTEAMGRGLANAKRQADYVKRSAGNILGSLAATVVGGLGVRAVVKSFTDLGAELEFMSQRVGVSVEQLSALKFAAEQSGTDIQTLETGFRGLSRTLYKASIGTMTSVRALDELGLSFQQLEKLTPDQQLMVVADALVGIGDTSKQSALAMELFGRAGQQMLPLLLGGSSAIKQLTDEAKRLGVTMDARQARAATDFRESIGKIVASLRGPVARIAIKIASVAEKIIAFFGIVNKVMNKTAMRWVIFAAVLGATLPILKKIVDAIRNVIVIIRAISTALAAIQAGSGVGLVSLGIGLVAAGATLAIYETWVSGLNDTIPAIQAEANQAASDLPKTLPIAVDKGAKGAKRQLDALQAQINVIETNLRLEGEMFDSVSGRGSQSAFASIYREKQAEQRFNKQWYDLLKRRAEVLEKVVVATDASADHTFPSFNIEEIN